MGAVSWKQTLVLAALMGVVAAGVVWFLERFETDRMHAQMREYLEKHEAFRLWTAEHGEPGGG